MADTPLEGGSCHDRNAYLVPYLPVTPTSAYHSQLQLRVFHVGLCQLTLRSLGHVGVAWRTVVTAFVKRGPKLQFCSCDCGLRLR